MRRNKQGEPVTVFWRFQEIVLMFLACSIRQTQQSPEKKTSQTKDIQIEYFSLEWQDSFRSQKKNSRSPVEPQNNFPETFDHWRGEEREKLLELLGKFFSIGGNDYRYDGLFDDYEWAVESGCVPSYNQLLESLHNSTLTFREFSVVWSDNDQGNMLYAQFHDPEVNIDRSLHQNKAIVPLRQSEIDQLASSVDVSEPSIKNLADQIADMRKDMFVYKSMVQYNHRELQQKCDDLYARYNSYSNEQLDDKANFREDIIALLSEVNRKDELVEVDIMSLPEDAFVFLMYKPFGLPAITAFLLFFIQMTTYFLAVSNNFILERESDFAQKPLLDIPVGVTKVVHAGQGIAIALIFIVNDGLWESSKQLLNGYNKDLGDHDIGFKQWLVSNLLRFMEGVGASMVLFFLIVQSDNIVELFKDFTAMTFISSLDNIVYQLAEMDVIGHRMKEATEISQIEVHIQTLPSEENTCGKLKYYFRHPITLNGVWFIIFYVTWLTIGVIPQINGDYLCQSILIQLDDHVNPNLSYFTGVYKLQKGNEKKNLFSTSYIEVKRSLNIHGVKRDPIILRFCESQQIWVFTFSDDKEECDNNRFIESTLMSDQQQYDLFNVPNDSWRVNSASNISEGYEDHQFMPLHNVFMTCIDRDDGVISTAGSCPTIEIDERKQFGPFISTKAWSNKYDRLRINTSEGKVEDLQVYNRPVYYSKLSNEFEVVLFTGRRWMITSSLFIYEPSNSNDKPININIFDDKSQPSPQKLAEKLQDDFHAYHSFYYPVFYSEVVSFETPEDSGIPVNLKWYEANSERRKADLKRGVSTLFLCTECDESNKCYFDNECKNKKCDCLSASRGVLCQVLPINDGRCNPYFNEQIFQFDGGDCCLHSCESQNENICGRDESSKFYTGYDLCEDLQSISGHKLNFHKMRSSEGYDHTVSQVSLSSNGRIMASIDSKTKSVRVYDNDGAKWIMRGSVLTTANDLFADSIEISSNIGFINTIESKPSPATVAVKIDGQVSIFDWIINKWEDCSFDLLRNSTVRIKEALLRNDGKAIGILYHNGTFTIFHRSFNGKQWYIRDRIDSTGKNKEYNFAALSYDGESYLLADEKTFFVHHENKNHTQDVLGANEQIKAIAMSSNGQHIVILIEYQSQQGKISLFDFEGGYWKEGHTSLRGVHSNGITMTLFDDGSLLSVHSNLEKSLIFYRKTKVWEQVHKMSIRVQRMALSMDRTVLAVIPEATGLTGDSDSSLKVYNTLEQCPNGQSRAHVTFNLDASRRALIWEISHISTPENYTILANGGPYEFGQAAITDHFCVQEEFVRTNNKDYNPPGGCINIKIRDLELDGLRKPGYVGITVNGKVFWNITTTDGYQNTFHIFGNSNCIETISRPNPWRKNFFDTSLHTRCHTMKCDWIRWSGNELSSFTNFSIISDDDIQISQPLSISSDGTIIALNEIKGTGNENGNVNVFIFNQTVWEHLGSSIEGNSDDQFGWSKSLSADGMTVAIGAPFSNVTGLLSGQVSVYSYDVTAGEWLPKGKVINGADGSRFGWSVKLSADGSIVAISSGTMHPTCHTHVYVFDEFAGNWIQRGDCLDALLGMESLVPNEPFFKSFHMDLSSNGWVIALGAPFSSATGLLSGQVIVYEFFDVLDKWEQRGKLIKSFQAFTLLGSSVSLSANGDIIAIGGIVTCDIYIYQYSSKEEWELFGSPIQTQGPADTAAIVQLALNSNGLGLTLSTPTRFVSYMYDETTSTWIHSFIETPEIENEMITPFSMSADGIVIALASVHKNEVVVYKLESFEKSKCNDKEYFFNFTITPDEFPNDLAWAVYDSMGFPELGAFFPETEGNTPTYIYEQCLPRENKLYTFAVYDFYGDGVCCNWGHGSYTLLFDSETVLTSKNFQKEAFSCLPDEGVVLIRIIITRLQETGGSINWNLLDTNLTKLADEATVINPFIYGICQQDKYCYTFALRNPSVESVHSQIWFGDTEYHSYSRNMPLDVMRVGHCTSNGTRSCQAGSKELTFEIFTDSYPSELYWSVVDSNGLIVNSSTAETHEPTTYYHYSFCLSEDINPCLTVVILDSFGDTGVVYSGSWGDQVFGNMTVDSVEKIILDNSTVCSRQMTCGDGFAVIDIEFVVPRGTGAVYSVEESWFEVRNEQNKTFVKGTSEIDDGEYRRQQACLPLPTSSTDANKCWTFLRITDPLYLVHVYQLTWNGEVIKKRYDGGFEVPIYDAARGPLSFGQCSNSRD